MCKPVQRTADLVDKLQFVSNPSAKADRPTFALSLISAYTWQLSIYDCNNFPSIHTLLTLLYIPPYLKTKTKKQKKKSSAHTVHFLFELQ